MARLCPGRRKDGEEVTHELVCFMAQQDIHPKDQICFEQRGQLQMPSGADVSGAAGAAT